MQGVWSKSIPAGALRRQTESFAENALRGERYDLRNAPLEQNRLHAPYVSNPDLAMPALTINLLLFAAARESAGLDSVELQFRSGMTIGDVRTALLKQHPNLEPIAASLLWAVNNEYAAADRVIFQHDTIACFPPVSGG